jgi:hypothetical protein
LNSTSLKIYKNWEKYEISVKLLTFLKKFISMDEKLCDRGKLKQENLFKQANNHLDKKLSIG